MLEDIIRTILLFRPLATRDRSKLCVGDISFAAWSEVSSGDNVLEMLCGSFILLSGLLCSSSFHVTGPSMLVPKGLCCFLRRFWDGRPS